MLKHKCIYMKCKVRYKMGKIRHIHLLMRKALTLTVWVWISYLQVNAAEKMYLSCQKHMSLSLHNSVFLMNTTKLIYYMSEL